VFRELPRELLDAHSAASAAFEKRAARNHEPRRAARKRA
jgi:hypothetical protein